MLKNPLHVYGPKDVLLPANLQAGHYFLEKMWKVKDKVALINGTTEERITYGEIAQQAMNLAVSLSHMGLRKGDRVAIFSENRVEFWGVFVGVACAGAVVTTANPGYIQEELRHVLSISKPKFIFCSPTTYKNNEKLLKTLRHLETIFLFGNEKPEGTMLYNDLTLPVTNGNNGPIFSNGRLNANVAYADFDVVDVNGQNDTVLILYSSGTTGLPKGVMLTHVNLLSVFSIPADPDPTRVYMTIAPWYHTMGLVGCLMNFSLARTVVYLPQFELELYLKTIEKYRITQINVVPPMIVAICKSSLQYDLSSIEVLYCGAAPLQKETALQVKTKFPKVHSVLQGYGMTEATYTLAKDDHRSGHNRPGSVGKAASGVTLKIVDVTTGKTLGPNQEGELRAKGPTIMKGYVGKDSKDEFDEEGFLKTGDIAYYDEDKFFFIVDRLKELIKYKGYQVAPAELEDLLLQHPAVRDAAVVGKPDETAGELPLAFIVRQPDASVEEKDIKEFVAQRLSNPKHLRGGVRFVESIPKNPSGKILRKELRKIINPAKSKL